MNLTRRSFLEMSAAALLVPLAGCASQNSSSGSTAGTTSAASSSPTAAATANATPPSQLSLSDLLAQTQGKFSQSSYADAQMGTTVQYALCPPTGYDASKTYPMVTFIGDATTVGKGPSYSLSQGYGAIAWASDYDQAVHPSYVLVPSFDSTVIDDNGGATKTDLLELTARLIDSVCSSNPVDRGRLYATGQSMGCMTMLWLAANHPDLFAAEMFVDGQWDVSELAGLSSQRFCYFAAGGDSKATSGQGNVEQMLSADGVSYSTTTLDATWDAGRINSGAQAMLDEGHACNFLSWVAGTVMSANPGKNMEHMASFDPAYKVDAVRAWLYQQSR